MDYTEVYFIRHSETVPKNNIKVVSVNESTQIANEKIILSITGEKKAEALSKCKELQNLDAVYSSNYSRTLATAKYIAQENNTILYVDDRLNERKIGNMDGVSWKEFYTQQFKDFNYKLAGGESLKQTKQRMIEAVKSMLMFETGHRVAVVSHSMAITCLLSAWCEMGHNYDDEIILSYEDRTIVDGTYTAPMIFKVVFEGMNVKSVECLNLLDE